MKKRFGFILIFSAVFSTSTALGAFVLKVKGNKCLVHLEQTSGSVGDYFSALDLYGNEGGIIQLTKVKKGKAIARIVEGSVGANWILEQTNRRNLSQGRSPSSMKSKIKMSFGLLPAFSYNSSTRKNPPRNIDNVRVTHSGIGGGGFINFNTAFTSYFALDVLAGGSYFRTTQTSHADICPRRRKCEAHVLWAPDLRLALQFKVPSQDALQFWASMGGGVSYWKPLAAENHDVIPADNVDSFKGSLIGSLGININLGGGLFIPIAVNYNWVEPSILQFGKSRQEKEESLSISQILFLFGVAKSI